MVATKKVATYLVVLLWCAVTTAATAGNERVSYKVDPETLDIFHEGEHLGMLLIDMNGKPFEIAGDTVVIRGGNSRQSRRSPTCRPYSPERIDRAIRNASHITRVPYDDIAATWHVETEMGTLLGSPGGIRDAKVNRDVIPFFVLARIAGVDPLTACASRAGTIGYGGAVGPAQFLPSVWLAMAGITVHFDEDLLFTSRGRARHTTDVAVAQRILVIKYPGFQPNEFGVLDRHTEYFIQSAKAETWTSRRGDWKEVCRYEVAMKGPIGICSKMLLLYSIPVQDMIRLEYNPTKNRISRVLGRHVIPNPWNPEHAAVATALLLLDNGIKQNRPRAYARYFGGYQYQSAAARLYAQKVMRVRERL